MAHKPPLKCTGAKYHVAKDSRNNTLSNYGAGILAGDKALARRISAVICNEASNAGSGQKNQPECSSYFFASPKGPAMWPASRDFVWRT